MLGELYQVASATPELFHKFMMNSTEMSKASRRKQSKPNRLLANEEGPITQPPTTEADTEATQALTTSPTEQV